MFVFQLANVRYLFGLLLALAFLAQSMIPSGYMPKLGTGKFFEITICHGAEMATLIVDDHMQPVKDVGEKDKGHNSTDQTKPCVFASISGKHLVFQSFLYQQTEHLTYERFVPRDTEQTAQNIETKSYLAQAPPVTHLII